jgi:hypothetical protein
MLYTWERRKMHTWFLIRKRDGKEFVGRPRHRWVDNIKIDPRGIG